MKKVIILLIAFFAISACSTLTSSQNNASVKTPQGTRYLDVKIMQTLDKNSALAHVKDKYGSYYGDLVKIITEKDMYYDDLVVQGYFVLVSTYTYITKSEIQKTVPVYIKLNEYREIEKSGRDIKTVVACLNL